MKTLILCLLVAGVGWGKEYGITVSTLSFYSSGECKDHPQFNLKKIGCNEYQVNPLLKDLSYENMVSAIIVQSHMRIVALEARIEKLEKRMEPVKVGGMPVTTYRGESYGVMPLNADPCYGLSDCFEGRK